MVDLLLDALLDTLKTVPFLFAAYLLLEYVEHRANSRFAALLAGPGGLFGGAVLGLVPQCGFSAVAANFFSGGVISAGTLLAVFLATSDEAIPILLANPQALPALGRLLLVKFVAALVFGFVIDLALRRFAAPRAKHDPHDLCDHCGCEDGHILRPALRHTLTITVFLFAANLVLGIAFSLVGEELLSRFLLSVSAFQPVLAALIGIIPNCAASILLTELYLSGALSFGSLAAGLCMGAGAGLIVLFRTNKNIKQNLSLTGAAFVCAVITGMVCDLLF